MQTAARARFSARLAEPLLRAASAAHVVRVELLRKLLLLRLQLLRGLLRLLLLLELLLQLLRREHAVEGAHAALLLELLRQALHALRQAAHVCVRRRRAARR